MTELPVAWLHRTSDAYLDGVARALGAKLSEWQVKLFMVLLNKERFRRNENRLVHWRRTGKW